MPYKDPEKQKQYAKYKYWKNRELNVQKSKEYRRKNLDKIRAQDRLRSKDKKIKFPNYQREWMLKKNYNLTIDEYNQIFERQNGVCAICKRSQKSKISLHVDHDHKTKKIRGLVCYQCNMAIGWAEKHRELFKEVGKYLVKHADLGAK